MATIKPYETAAGKRYRVRYRKPDKSQTDKRGFKTKREAELFAASVTVSKATGEYIDPALGRVTIGHLADAWLAGKKTTLKPSSYTPLASSWKTHVEPHWAHREVKGISRSEIQDWVTTLSEEKSATVVKRALGVLAGILDRAMADRRILRNEAREVSSPRKATKARIYLTHEQVHKLANVSAYPALILTLAYTGLRWGEATGLRVKHLNEVRRRLQVEENAVLVGSVIHVGSAKNHERRSVPFPAFLAPYLHREVEGKRPDQLIFGDGDSHLRRSTTVSGWFDSAVAAIRKADQESWDRATKAERKTLTIMPKITPHDLRHTAASLAISAGANVKAVQRMLGHASAAMTLDTYADLFDDDLEAVADKLDHAAAPHAVGKMWASASA